MKIDIRVYDICENVFIYIYFLNVHISNTM